MNGELIDEDELRNELNESKIINDYEYLKKMDASHYDKLFNSEEFEEEIPGFYRKNSNIYIFNIHRYDILLLDAYLCIEKDFNNDNFYEELLNTMITIFFGIYETTISMDINIYLLKYINRKIRDDDKIIIPIFNIVSIVEQFSKQTNIQGYPLSISNKIIIKIISKLNNVKLFCTFKFPKYVSLYNKHKYNVNLYMSDTLLLNDSNESINLYPDFIIFNVSELDDIEQVEISKYDDDDYTVLKYNYYNGDIEEINIYDKKYYILNLLNSKNFNIINKKINSINEILCKIKIIRGNDFPIKMTSIMSIKCYIYYDDGK